MKMRPTLVVCLVFLSANSLAAAWYQQQTFQSPIAALNNKDVLEMLKLGLSPEIVVAKIRNTKCSFETSVVALKDLKAAAVPDPVLLAMVQAPSPQDAVTPTSSTQLRDSVPLLQTLPWPIIVLVVLIVWGRSLSRLLLALVQRVESGAQIEVGGVVLHEPPDETYEPYGP